MPFTHTCILNLIVVSIIPQTFARDLSFHHERGGDLHLSAHMHVCMCDVFVTCDNNTEYVQ